MSLARQWHEILDGLAEDWADARVRLSLADEREAGRAAALLGPINPWREGGELRFFVARSGTGVGANAAGRALARLDRERIGGTLELLASDTAPAAAPEAPPQTLAQAWDALVASLPPDWSDLYLELDLRSSDYVARASLNMTPLNARRTEERAGLRFRAARRFGYGGAPEMVRRCLERCDEDGIDGELRLLRVLSDTLPVGTQGPVWLIGGRTV